MTDLPASTQRYLAERTPEGERNAALFAAACQFRDAIVTLGEAERALIPCAVRDGLSEAEARKAIRSAFKGNRREPIRHRFMDRGGQPAAPAPPQRNGDSLAQRPSKPARRFRALAQGEPLPDALTGTQASVRLLESGFEPGETVSIAPGVLGPDGRDHPASAGVTRTREEWIAAISGEPDATLWPRPAGAGVFVRANPVKPGGKADADVTAFRHVLLEWDDIPLDRQWAIIRDSRIPCTAVVHSGGRSLHAWVRVDARGEQEYRERVAVLYEHFADCPPCPNNKNPSRFSRLPGAARGEKQQTLLATRIGAACFDEWRQVDQDRADGIQIFSFGQLTSYDFANDPNTLIGNRWICRGGSVMWVGQSGIGKSSLASQAAMCWAIGTPFFGVVPVRPLRSLVIQAENDIGDLAEATQGVRRAIGFEPGNTARSDIDALLESNFISVRNTSRTGRSVIELATRLIERYRPDILWLDPLLAYVGDDIKQQKVASQFLREGLGTLQMSTGVVVMLVHHTPKPQKARDGSRPEMTDEDFLYAGLGSVEFVNWPRATVVLRQHGQDESGKPYFVLRFQKRGERAGCVDVGGAASRQVFLQHGTEYISWRQIAEPHVVPVRSRNSGMYEAKFQPSDLLGFLNDKESVKTSRWQSVASTELGISKTTFHRLREALLKDGKVEKKEDGYVTKT